MPRLIVIKGVDEGKQFELSGGVLNIGRDAHSTLRLHDTEVSRRHAEFHPLDNGGYKVLDVGSANGTFVNNVLMREAILQSGDHVQIGQTILVFSSGRTGAAPVSDLADRISMITRQDVELSSAIVKTINETEGSRILAKPEQVGTPWLKSALANLSVMYEASQAVSHILDLDQLLERIMELIFKSIDADDVVHVELVGACGTCPVSTMTLKAGVERIIKDRVPEVAAVVADNVDTDDGLF